MNYLRACRPFGQFQSGPTLSSATASSSQIAIQRCSMRFGASNRRLIRMTGTGIRTRRPCDIAFSANHRSGQVLKELERVPREVVDRRGRIVVLGELGILLT